MTVELAARLLRNGLVPEHDVRTALRSAIDRGIPFVVALSERGGDVAAIVDQELTRLGVPVVSRPTPLGSLMSTLPAGMCERLLAVPVRIEPRSGRIDVAAVDPSDPVVVAEFGHQLGAPIRVMRTPLDEMRSVLGRVERGRRSVPPPPPVATGSAGAVRATPAFGVGPSLAGGPSGEPPAAPSEPPIPLIRQSLDSSVAEAPSRAKRQGTNPGFGAPEPETFGLDEAGEPVIGLYRSKAPPAPEPTSAPSVSGADLDVGELAAFLERIGRGRSPDEVVDLLVTAMGRAADQVAVFVVRGGAFQGRGGSSSIRDHEALCDVRIPASGPSVFETAVQAGFYLGPIPRTAVHDGLRRVLEIEDEEIYATPSMVSGHPVIVLVASRFADSATSTRWADQLARAAADALAAMLRGRKGH